MATEPSAATESIIRELLETGEYDDRNAVVDDAIALLARRRTLRRQIQQGADSGPSVSEDEVFKEIDALIDLAAEKPGRDR